MFQCSKCSKEYKNFESLRRHAKQKHADQINEISKLADRKFRCAECEKQYNTKEYLSKHERKTHNIEYVKSSQFLECALCNFKHFRKHEMLLHISESHELNIIPEEREFQNEEDFIRWKKNEEKITKCAFVANGGKHKERKIRSQTLVCHRSQYYTSKGSFTRSLKLQGSCKLNAFCPAEIKYTEANGIYKVKYINAHTHETELAHLRLTEDVRCELAKKIAAGIPFDTILDQIRESLYEGDELTRVHLLTKKDMHNIERSFNLRGMYRRHDNDATSVEGWIQEEMQLCAKSCVLFYKPQNQVLQEFPEFISSDFVLIIMNNAQAEILKKFGTDTICMDGTFGLNQYDFQLITLLVIDDVRQGFPCSFLISNRCDEVVLKVFFHKIKENIGEINIDNFMSDMDEAFFNAYKAVMPLPKRRLFCTWHVDRAWRKNLPKIRSKEKQCEVYKLLRILMEETDDKTFEVLFEKFKNFILKDTAAEEFGKYFLNHYEKNVESWAFCYRLHSGVNTNMHLERMHRTLKEFYCHGKKIKRLDKMLNILQKFVTDRLYDRLITTHKGKITSKISDLRKRHLTSTKLDISKITEYENGWIYPSFRSSEIYFIQRGIRSSDQCDCYLKCAMCNQCIHAFSCTCSDNAVKWNMCKHIHLLCQSEFMTTTRSINNDMFPNYSEDKSREENVIVSELTKNKNLTRNKDKLKEEKQNLIEDFKKLVNEANSEEFQGYKKEIIKMKTIAAVRKESQNLSLYNEDKEEGVKKQKEPGNKNMPPQKRFFSTKKQRKDKPNKIAKPDQNDKFQLSLKLLTED